MEDHKQKALSAIRAQIDRQYGKGALMTMSDGSVVPNIGVISTGSLGLDIALGVGGLPKARITEIYGQESSGKTTLALQVVAQCQKLGGTAAYMDAEHALDVGYAENWGKSE